MNYAYTTLLGTDDYLYPVLALDYTLKQVKSKYPLVVMVTDGVSTDILEILNERKIPYKIFPDLTKSVPYFIRFHNRETVSGRDMFQIIMMNKFYMFELKEYDKVCYFDADILIRKNIDFIFNYSTPCGKVLDYKRPFVAGEQLLINPKDYNMLDIIDKHTIFAHDELVYCSLYPIYTFSDCRLTDDANYILHAHAHGNLYQYWKHFQLSTIEQLYRWCDDMVLNLENATFYAVKNIYSEHARPLVETEENIVINPAIDEHAEENMKAREEM